MKFYHISNKGKNEEEEEEEINKSTLLHTQSSQCAVKCDSHNQSILKQ